MLEISNAKDLIRFIIPLFKESVQESNEFDFIYSDVDSVNYFMGGGCVELAKVVKHYFPDSRFALRKDHAHMCTYSECKLYDAMDYYEDWQIERYNIQFEEKDLTNFDLLEDKEIDELPVQYGSINYINGLEISDFIIKELDSIESIKIKKKSLK